jgi:hypothetical protein
MNSRTSVWTRVIFVILLLAGMFVTTASNSGVSAADRGRDRCKRRCEEVYKGRKYECKRFRGRERHRCEEEAKRERNQCKDRCR